MTQPGMYVEFEPDRAIDRMFESRGFEATGPGLGLVRPGLLASGSECKACSGTPFLPVSSTSWTVFIVAVHLGLLAAVRATGSGLGAIAWRVDALSWLRICWPTTRRSHHRADHHRSSTGPQIGLLWRWGVGAGLRRADGPELCEGLTTSVHHRYVDTDRDPTAPWRPLRGWAGLLGVPRYGWLLRPSFFPERLPPEWRLIPGADA